MMVSLVFRASHRDDSRNKKQHASAALLENMSAIFIYVYVRANDDMFLLLAYVKKTQPRKSSFTLFFY